MESDHLCTQLTKTKSFFSKKKDKHDGDGDGDGDDEKIR